MKLKVLDLFSGIGGASLGLHRTGGFETVAFCEIEPFPRKVLKKNFPGIPIFKDVRELHAEDLPGPVDVIWGSYPCQPFSQLGQRDGKEDERHLWPEVLRLIQECRPAWCLCENVAGHVTMGLDEVISDLEAEGYTVWPFVIPACAVNAPHRRDRLWILAHNDSIMRQTVEVEAKFNSPDIFQKPEQWEQFFFINHGDNNIEFRKEDEHKLCGRDDGLSEELDEDRLKALGNTVVPQIVEMIGHAVLAQHREIA
jgi:DNA (cytosine-5)-methyltransferase 1